MVFLFSSIIRLKTPKASITALSLIMPFYQMPLSAHCCFQSISQICSLLPPSTTTAQDPYPSPKWAFTITDLPSLTSFNTLTSFYLSCNPCCSLATLTMLRVCCKG